MNTDFLTSLEHVCWVLGMLAAVVSAWFKLRSTWLSRQEDREALQAKYRARWEILRNKRYLELPERGVRWLLGIKAKPKRWAEVVSGRLDTFLDKGREWIFIAVICIPGTLAVWNLYGSTLGIAVILGALILTASFKILHKVPDWCTMVVLFLIGMYMLVSCVPVLQLSLSSRIYWTALILIGIMPLYALMLSQSCRFFHS